MSHRRASLPQRRINAKELRRIALFRYKLRRFLRFSERAARRAGVTPQQHQLLLGVAGFTGRGWVTISELAEFLQERHNAVVGLVERAGKRGLVHKERSARDHRVVRVTLTRLGARVLEKLTRLHLDALRRVPSHAARASGKSQGTFRAAARRG